MAAYTETTGTLSNSATTLPAAERLGLIIGNPSDTVMTVRVGGTASATAGVPLPAGGRIEWVSPRSAPSQSISIFCAGASKAFVAYEW